MGFFKNLNGYVINAYCENCGKETTLRIPRGMYIYEFLKTEKSKCMKCGCRVRKMVNEDLDPEGLEREHKKELSSLRERLRKNKVD